MEKVLQRVPSSVSYFQWRGDCSRSERRTFKWRKRGLSGTRLSLSAMSMGVGAATENTKSSPLDGRNAGILGRKKGSQIDPTGIIKENPELKPFAQILRDRYKALKDLRERIETYDESLVEFARAYLDMGLRRHPRHGVEFYDWAPGARFFALVGDFNEWAYRVNAAKEPLKQDDMGYWRAFVQDVLREGQEEDHETVEYLYEEAVGPGDRLRGNEVTGGGEVAESYWEEGEDEFLREYDPGDGSDLWRYEGKVSSALTASTSTVISEDPFARSMKPLAEDAEVSGAELAADVALGDEVEVNERAEGSREGEEGAGNRERMDAGGLPSVAVTGYASEWKETGVRVVSDDAWRLRIGQKATPGAYWEADARGRAAWEQKYSPGIPHLGRVRTFVYTPEGPAERVPAWAQYVVTDPDRTDDRPVNGVMWDPPPEERHRWQHEKPPRPPALRILECHVGGSAKRRQRPTAFDEFRLQVLPYAKEMGYNAVQLMGVQQHIPEDPFGHKVTGFFAVCSRFGTPEDFKRLVDEAHGMGLLVLMDIVHSYAADVEVEGLSLYDGLNDCFFHTGRKGRHNTLGTRIFDHGNYEVIRFLLSNLKWWVDEYRIDGFNFHSVTSMLYTHNGSIPLTSVPEEYFNKYMDTKGIIYLMLANLMLHEMDPNIVTIADDVSVYPGLCAPINQGGLGFDYRLSMSSAKMWSHLLQNVPIDEWSMSQIVGALKGRAASYDRVLVAADGHSQHASGDPLVMEILVRQAVGKASSAVPSGPSTSPPVPSIDSLEDEEKPLQNEDAAAVELKGNSPSPAINLHKMIRLLTLSLGGESYSAYVGESPGKPKAPKSPRPGWDENLQRLVESHVAAFEKVMLSADASLGITTAPQPLMYAVSESEKVIAFARGRLLFAFNFHPTESYMGYGLQILDATEVELVVDTDRSDFGGSGRMPNLGTTLRTSTDSSRGRHTLSLSIPSLSAQVYRVVRVWESLKQQ